MLRLSALLCFVAGLAGLIWTGPAIFELHFGDFDPKVEMNWQMKVMDWLSDRDLEQELERQLAEMENEIMLFTWGITISFIGLCVLGVFLWRKSRHRLKVQTASVSV